MSERYFPFHRLGFRSNPFRTLTREELADVAVIPPDISTLLSERFTHLQILGEQGRGKTTTLLALQRSYIDLGKRTAYAYLKPGQHALRTNTHGLELFLLDEFQRLSVKERRRLIQQTAKVSADGLQLLFASHEDFTDLFQAHARPLSTHQLERRDPVFLKAMIEKRLLYFAFDDQPEVTLNDKAIEALTEWFSTDLRSIETFLYDVFQRLQNKGEISSDQLRRYKTKFKNCAERE